MATTRRERGELATGLAFLTPNILGFVAFVLFPLVFSLVMAFSNWDLTQHNRYKDEIPRWVGLGNFIRLFTEPAFRQYLGNTLFLMMGIPFSIGGSLVAAMLLSKDLSHRTGRSGLAFFAVVGLIAATAMLAVLGMGGTGMVILLVGVAGGILVLGAAGGNAVYRTLFYLPHFTAGVATYILWKKLYNPLDGPINLALTPLLEMVTAVVNALPAATWAAVAWAMLLLMVAALVWGSHRLVRQWADGELGTGALAVPLLVTSLPALLSGLWGPTLAAQIVLPVVGAGLVLAAVVRLGRGRMFTCPAGEGLGTALMLAAAVMVVGLVLLGLANVAHALPAMAGPVDASGRGGGLAPPHWLSDYDWAKPAIMIMSFWAAVGSNNMLLYLAALTNVPQELYEAADIDGATRFQRFWNVTWPQLAPTTFFIVVMSMIGGLQGGFEMARTMTRGGPAGATTTLSYYVYTEGFETGRLGYASAVAWTLFAFIFLITLFNWKFGNRYVNE